MRHPRDLLLALILPLGLALLGVLPSPAEEAVNPEKIDRLIEQMGSGTFAEREQATKALDAIGVPALKALRKAAKSDDAEVRRRAVELVKKLEKQAESARILAPKRVHLVYKDTPLREAVADFQKQSSYRLYLHDPQGKLKERTITLDTGKTTFWHALALFCEQARLTEATAQDLMAVPPPVGVPVPPARPGALLPAPPAPPRQGPGLAAELPADAPAPRKPQPGPAVPAIPPPPPIMPGVAAMPFMPAMASQILLKDGKPRKLPTDDRSAVRVRALPKADALGPVAAGEMLLALEVAAEQKLQWQMTQSVRIDKALDDQGQNLTQITPQVPAGPRGAGFPIAPGAAPMMAPFMPGFGGLAQRVPIQLKKGEKAAKTLKELAGVISAQVLTEAQPLLTADNLAKAAGKTFKGDEGGAIKVLSVKTDEQKQTTIQFAFEQPPNTIPAAAPWAPAMAVPVPVPPLPAAPAVAPAIPAPAPPAAQAPAAKPAVVQLQVQIRGGIMPAPGGGPMLMGPIMGLSVQDDKGNTLPVQMGGQRFQVMRGVGGANVVTATYTIVCRPGKDQKEPARLVYLGRKQVAIEVPFTLKDVPLP
jgi:hypothetical protein